MATTIAFHTSWAMAASWAWPLAVRMMIGKSLVAGADRRAATTSRPLISGIMMSAISKSGFCSSMLSKASLPELVPWMTRSGARRR